MRAFRTLLAATMTAGALVAMAQPASAAGCLDLVFLQFDSPGDDNYSNDSLNGEYVTIKNDCKKKKRIGGMTIADEDKVRYTLPSRKLKPKRSVTIHTGAGTNTKTDLYIGSKNYIWNNGSDTAFLRNKAGVVTGRCAYDSSDPGGSVVC